MNYEDEIIDQENVDDYVDDLILQDNFDFHAELQEEVFAPLLNQLARAALLGHDTDCYSRGLKVLMRSHLEKRILEDGLDSFCYTDKPVRGSEEIGKFCKQLHEDFMGLQFGKDQAI